MVTGKLIVAELNIRPTADTTKPAIGKLKMGDILEADSVKNGWWLVKKITRAGVNIPLPTPVCYAYEGVTRNYIQTLSSSTPPVPTTETVDKPRKVTIEMESGKIYVSTTFTELE